MAGKFKYLAKHVVKITRGQNKGKRYTRYFYKGDVKKGTSLAKALSKEDKRALAEGFGAKTLLFHGIGNERTFDEDGGHVCPDQHVKRRLFYTHILQDD